jgi:DNA-binding NarL/FixJ family response regulator
MHVHGLLIEDSDFDAKAIELCAREIGGGRVLLDRVSSVEQARACLNGHQIIVTDLMLEDTQGVDTIRKVRSFARHLPIVVLSAIDDLDVVADVIRQGIDEYVLKTEGYRGLIIAIATAIVKNERRKDVHRFCDEVETLLSGAEKCCG